MANLMTKRNRQIAFDNLVWFSASLMLAIIVWLTASYTSDPIVERGFPERIPIQVLVDDNVIVTSNTTQRAYVVILSQESVFEELAADDIEVIANLTGITELGRQTVPLEARIATERQARVMTISPSQITVELEQRQEKLVPLNVVVEEEPPASFEVSDTILSVPQVQITGAASDVTQVVMARVSLNLNNQRESLELDIRPEPLNAEGDVVNRVDVVPETVGITVDIEPRSDVSEVRVTPNLVGELPAGYTLTGDFNYTPETVFISGPPDVLERLPGTVLTAPIDLSLYTDDFEVQVPLQLPDERLVLITGQRVTVSVGIDAIQSSRQFERIPIEIIGLSETLNVSLAPPEVTVLVNGPQAVLEGLNRTDIRVLVDVNAITEPGTYQLEPSASLNVGAVEPGNISVLPATVDVQVSEAGADETPTP